MTTTSDTVWLVTGATGFLGTALVERLLVQQARGEPRIPTLRLLVRPGSRREPLQAVLQRHPQAAVQWREGTLETPESAAAALDGAELVLHLAASMAGQVSALFAGTVGSTRMLLEGWRLAGARARVLLVSSFGVYAAAELPQGACVDETTPLEPRPALRDAYSHAKLAQEELLRSWQRRHGLRASIARPGVIYGPQGPAISARVGLQLGPLFLHLGGRNPLPLTYVDNCADALIAIALAAPFEGEATNIVDDERLDAAHWLAHWRHSGARASVVRLPWAGVRLLAWAVGLAHRATRRRFPLLTTPYRARATWRAQRYDNQRLHALGWQPAVPLDEALRRTFSAPPAR